MENHVSGPLPEPARRHLVILIDDSPEDRLVFERYLRNEYDVKTFKSGESALDELNDTLRPDLILLDLVMPGMSGFDVMRQLRSAPQTKMIPVVFVTSSDEVADEFLGLSLGAVDYVTKPIQPVLLLARIRNHLALVDAQRMLANANWELEERIAERTSQLQDALIVAESGRKTQQQFLSTMSHELRTPMNGILGISALLQEMNLTEEQATLVRILDESANSLMKTLGSILDYVATSNGGHVGKAQELSLRNFVLSLASDFRDIARSKSLEFRWHIDDVIPDVLTGSWSQIRLVLSNLLDNAFKFSNSGHVSLTIEPRSLSRTQVVLMISIADTGCGIPPEKLAHIFEPFRQADGSNTRRHGGIGLGLTIARQHIELMNGEVEVQSQPGRGTLAIARIPMRIGE
jgi:signal transduction histidine kinase